MRASDLLPPPVALGDLQQDRDGALHGWCWYPDQPLMRATIDLLRDGEIVRSIRAIRLRTDLRDRSIGDGHCGFWFPPTVIAWSDGPRTVLEVRERRWGTTVGRVVLGHTDPALEGRLHAAGAALEEIAAGSDTLSGLDLTSVFGALGCTLLHLAGRPDRTPALGLGLPGLQACLQKIASVPAMDFGYCAGPKVSVIVPAIQGDVWDLAGRLRDVGRALAGHVAELVLLDSGAIPLAALLPTRLRGLILVQAGDSPGRGSSLNSAVAAARAPILAIARPGGPAAADFETAIDLPPSVVVIDGGCLHGRLISEPTRHWGLQCIIHRSDLTAMGGFDPWADESGLWLDLLAKADALGLVVTTWQAAQAAYRSHQ